MILFQVCSDHLQPPLEGASHYKAVCRALVAEAVELATFLEKMASSSEEVCPMEVIENPLCVGLLYTFPRLLQADDHDCVDAEMDQLEKLKRADWVSVTALPSCFDTNLDLQPLIFLRHDCGFKSCPNFVMVLS